MSAGLAPDRPATGMPLSCAPASVALISIAAGIGTLLLIQRTTRALTSLLGALRQPTPDATNETTAPIPAVPTPVER